MLEILEQLLKEKNWSYYRLAQESGVKESTLTSLRLGKSKSMSFDKMIKIAKALDVSLDVFIPD